MNDFNRAYSGLQDLIYNDPCEEQNFNPFSLDWEYGETLCVISAHDKEIALESELYTAIGMVSCGE